MSRTKKYGGVRRGIKLPICGFSGTGTNKESLKKQKQNIIPFNCIFNPEKTKHVALQTSFCFFSQILPLTPHT